MKRTLTLTFEFDDGPWFSADEGVWEPTDAVAFAMDSVNGVVTSGGYCADFVSAKLDGEVLVDANGFVAEEVKKRELQYRKFMRWSKTNE